MPRVFSEYDFHIEGRVLGREAFVPFCDSGGFKLNPKDAAGLIADAEAILDEPYPLLTASLYHEVFRSGSRLLFEVPQRRRRELLMTFFMAEYAERKGRFTERIVDGIWLLCEESTWNLPNHVPKLSFYMPDSGMDMEYLDLFSSEAGSNFAWIYYLGAEILDPISPNIRKRIKAEVKKRIITPFLTHEYRYFGSDESPVAGNWCVWVISNVLAAAAFTEDDMAVRESVVKRALHFADRYPNGLPNDGSCIEGPRYYGHGVGSYFDTLELLYDLTSGYVDVFDHPFVRCLGEYAYKMHICSRNYFAYGDAPFLLDLPYRLFYRFGKRIGSEPLMNFACHFAKNDIPEQFGTYYHTYRALANMSLPDLQEQHWTPPSEIWQKDFGLLILREKHETEQGLVLCVHCGNNGEGHGHVDTGVFTVFADGHPLIIDPGVGEYRADTFSGSREATFWYGSPSHNLPEIAGYPQRKGSDAIADDRYYDSENKMLSVQLASTYPKEAGVCSYRRSYYLEAGRAVITDCIDAPSASIVFHLSCYDEPAPVSPGVILLYGGHILRYDENLTAEIEYVACDSKLRAEYLGREGIYLINLRERTHKNKKVYTIEIQKGV